MHSSGSITRKFGPSWKQSTGHTSTQSVCLHLMQFSVTTKGMGWGGSIPEPANSRTGWPQCRRGAEIGRRQARPWRTLAAGQGLCDAAGQPAASDGRPPFPTGSSMSQRQPGIASHGGENTAFIVLISCVATLGGFLFGFDSGVINGTVDGLRRLQLHRGGAWFRSRFDAAGVCGRCLPGRLAGDRLGRRGVLIVSALMFWFRRWAPVPLTLPGCSSPRACWAVSRWARPA